MDRRLPWGLVGTLDYIYNRDLDDPVYINANLPAPHRRTFTGVDNRPRWATTAFPVPGVMNCVTTLGLENGACGTRLNNTRGNAVTANYVIKNQGENNSWNLSGSLAKSLTHGFGFKGGFNYGVSKSVVEPSSTAGSSWGSNPIVFDPNNPQLAKSQNSAGQRVLRVGEPHGTLLRVGSDDDFGVLRRAAEHRHVQHGQQGELRVRWRRQR